MRPAAAVRLTILGARSRPFSGQLLRAPLSPALCRGRLGASSYFDFELTDESHNNAPLDAADVAAVMLLPSPLAEDGSSSGAVSLNDEPRSESRKRASPSEQQQASSADHLESPKRARRTIRRTVSFSECSVVRVTELVGAESSPVPHERAADQEANVRVEDGPRPAATLLDDLIVVRTLATHISALKWPTARLTSCS